MNELAPMVFGTMSVAFVAAALIAVVKIEKQVSKVASKAVRRSFYAGVFLIGAYYLYELVFVGVYYAAKIPLGAKLMSSSANVFLALGGSLVASTLPALYEAHMCEEDES